MNELQTYEHNNIEDLSAFEIQFEKRRTGWQDLEGVWHCDDDIGLNTLGPDDLYQLRTGAVINAGTESCDAKMGLFGSKYQLVNHTDYFAKQNDAIMDQDDLDWRNVKVIDNVYEFGAKVQRSIHFLEHTKNFGKNDAVCLRSDTFNSVDQSWKFQQFIGAYRSLCRNTLVFGGERTFHTKKKHTTNLDVSAVIGKASAALGLFSSNVELLDKMRSIPCDLEQARELFTKTIAARKPSVSEDQSKSYFTKTKLEYMLHRYLEDLNDLGPNLWLVYNCLTHWSTHTNETFERESVDQKGNCKIVTLKTSKEGSKVWNVQRQRQEKVSQVLTSDHWQKLLAA
tara:strand:- start:50 stop:1069 length:1020 start_codon:yes stop_codon:yes gene_type:complete